VDIDPDVLAVAGQMLVNRVVHHLKHTVVKTAFIRITDVHSRPETHGLQAFEFLDLVGSVSLISRYGGGI
jgi:hypothetical protein